MAGKLPIAMVMLVALTLSGCDRLGGKKDENGFSKSMPDFGGVKVVEVVAEGVGPTRNAAILDALNLAVQQTNGTPIVGISVNSTGNLSVSNYDGDFGLTNTTVVSATQGAVQGFEILSEKENAEAGAWRLKLKVKVNKYSASAATNLPKIAIASPRTRETTYVIGDETLSANEASQSIGTAINESLSQSNRFFVINRAFDSDIADELSRITDPSTNSGELAKLGQRLTADILVLPEINRLSYKKSTRVLRNSGRELNSYSGDMEITFNVINVPTGQLIMTERFKVTFPNTPPSVYGKQQIGLENVRASLATLTGQFTQKFILKNFPVSVIKMNGTSVVLSQGQDVLQVGAIYNAVSLGEDIVDPQTGQSLGREEMPIGTITITKTSEKMSMGQFQGTYDASQFKPGIIELAERIDTPPVAGPTTAQEPAQPAAATSLAAVAKPSTAAQTVKSATAPAAPKRPAAAKPAKPVDPFEDDSEDF
jgi:curli biogenesis system outer membrane secretion channel CsgG